MKVFISWSRDSRAFAEHFAKWLGKVAQHIEVFISTGDIAAGEDWKKRLLDELDATSIAIMFLTKNNMLAPWLHFEAGSLFKRHLGEESRIIPVALDFRPGEIPSPLNTFQGVSFTKKDVLKLIRGLCKIDPDMTAERQKNIEELFEDLWPKIDGVYQEAYGKPGDMDEKSMMLKHIQSEIKSKDQVFTTDSEFFSEVVSDELREFISTLEKWKKSVIEVPENRYENLLKRLYNRAKRNIFSTSVLEYSTIWRGGDRFGQELLAIQRDSEADVTRIFIFDRQDEISMEFLDIMQRQRDEFGIDVRVYVNELDKGIDWGRDSRDFTIVDDGEVIGLTTRIHRGFAAEFHFRNESFPFSEKKWMTRKERLLEGSRILSDLD